MSKVARRAALLREAAGFDEAAGFHETAAMAATAAVAPPAAPACARCAHREDDRHVLEQRVAGLIVFSSGFGASVAASRLCGLHDRLVSPGDYCGQFVARA
ncbi:hypothetical protein [Paraburkholderia sp. J12]|uniref:hypothetical protein n=1 Tax=Paraburkholderia sp. J12 TaxID=2805432 RepID=UPI002ABD9C38|nr:hypothetical protein [Paraburkholderia sp. J12]